MSPNVRGATIAVGSIAFFICMLLLVARFSKPMYYTNKDNRYYKE